MASVKTFKGIQKMLLASYVGVRPGLQGLNNRLISYRLKTKITHNELVFEDCDGVDDLMPDKTTKIDSEGKLWCASSVIAEKLPDFSPVRPGGFGGVRFKRIDIYNGNWLTIKLPFSREKRIQAAKWFKDNQGAYYDYPLIAEYVLWALGKDKFDAYICSESIAASLGIGDPFRINPPILHTTLAYCSYMV